MTITAKEYNDLLSFFSVKSSAHNIISLALTAATQTEHGSVVANKTLTMLPPNVTPFSSAAAASSVTSLASSSFEEDNNKYNNMNAINVNSKNDDDDFTKITDDSDSEQAFLLNAVNGIDLTGIEFGDIFEAASTTAATAIFNSEDIINATLSTAVVVATNSTISALNGNQSAPIIPRISPTMPIWLIPCYSIILLFAIVGNLLVISTLVQNRRMRTITNVFLLNLAISDILLGVLCMPVTLTGTLLRHFIFGEFFCKLIQFSQATSVAVSSWTLVAISCERYYAICHPLRSRTWQTINHAYKIIGFIWFGSMVCMTPIAAFSRLMPTSRRGLRKCREHWPEYAEDYERSYNLFLDLILLVLPLLILCIAYILITRTLYVGMKMERAMIFGGTTSSTTTGGKGETVATMTTVPLMPSSGFRLNMSFRCQRQRNASFKNAANNSGNVTTTSHSGCDMIVNNANNNSSCVSVVGGGGGGGGNGGGSGVGGVVGGNGGSVILQQTQRKQRRQKHKQQQQLQCFGDEITHSGSKRKLLTASDGRRHLYCMRSASMKSLNRTGSNANNNNGIGASASPSPSMTVINMPQHQRFQLHQQRHPNQDSERRKSTSTPSLRIKEAALRRSNETKNLESKKRVVKMLFVLVLEFFICWTPLYVINTLAIFIGSAMYEYIDYTSISFLQLLAYSSSCCNPITYCFMNAGFRRAFLDTFKGMHLKNGRFWRKRPKTGTNLSVAGNSIALANSGTMMSTNTMLDSPRL